MKKILLTALTVMAAMTAGAADRVVFENGQMSAGYEVQGWWNEAFGFDAANPDGDGNVFYFKASGAEGGRLDAASMGIMANTDETCTGPLHSATLNFGWYATTAGQKYTIRVTGNGDNDYSFTTTEDNINKWNQTSLVVADVFPKAAQAWKDYADGGANFVFSVVLDNGVEGSMIYIDKVVYTNLDESWVAPEREELPAPTTVPVPVHDAANVVSIFGSAYPAATTFGIGNWSQSTQPTEMEIDGKKAMKVTRFNYLGWEFAQHLDVTSCNMMHVDFFPSNEGSFGFTPISPSAEKAWVASEVKVGEWNSYDVALTHWDNVNFADVYQIKFDQGNGTQEGYIANVYFYNDGNLVIPEPETFEYGAVWYGTAEQDAVYNEKTYTAHVDYSVVANEDNTATVNATISGLEGVDGLVYEINFDGDYQDLNADGENFTATSNKTYELGDNIAGFFWIKYAMGGTVRIDFNCKFGAANEKPVTAIKPALKAEAQNVTATGAEIAYTVTLPAELEGADVKVFYDETEATANPIVLSDLNDNTAYSYTLKAVATLGEETYESNPVKVDFRTLRDGAKPMVWYGIADDIVKNAYFTTETADDRRDIPMSIEAVATYNADQTMTVVATPHCQGAITGLVPHITLKGKYDRKPMTVNPDGTWSVTTPAEVTYEFGENFDYFYFFLAYDGGDTGNGFFLRGYKAGDENEPVAYGEPAALNLSLSKSALKVGESTAVSAVVTDANGHYLLDEAAEIEVDNTSFTVENNKITATDRGLATVTATAGTITATAEIICVTSSNAKDLIDLADESCIITHSGTIAAGSDVNFAFNKDEGNELSWDCSNDNYSHWVSVNFGKLKKIQAIELVWEGASAKEYTVTLSKTAPADSKRKAFDQNGTTFTVTDGVGGAGMVVRQVLHDKEFKDIEAQHVTLQTVAPSTGWGIKLKQMYVYGTDASTSGIENVEAEAEGAVEYFNLQGVRVENPESGLYIRRQGNKATKVFVK